MTKFDRIVELWEAWWHCSGEDSEPAYRNFLSYTKSALPPDANVYPGLCRSNELRGYVLRRDYLGRARWMDFTITRLGVTLEPDPVSRKIHKRIKQQLESINDPLREDQPALQPMG